MIIWKEAFVVYFKTLITRAVCNVRRLAEVRRCYAKGGGDSYAKL
jgi:hypothetical protein